MQPVSRSGLPITDFVGLVTNTGRVATDDDVMAAEIQVNLVGTSKSEIASRPGLRPVVFDEDLEDS